MLYILSGYMIEFSNKDAVLSPQMVANYAAHFSVFSSGSLGLKLDGDPNIKLIGGFALAGSKIASQVDGFTTDCLHGLWDLFCFITIEFLCY